MFALPPRRYLFFCAILVTLPALAGFAKAASLPTNQCAITAGSAVSPCPQNANNAIPASIPDSTPSNSGGCTPNVNCVGSYNAVRSDPGDAGIAIDAWNYCRYIKNTSANESIFVPFKSAFEWTSFITSSSGGGPVSNIASLATCARPGSLPVPDDFPTYPDGTPNAWYDPAFACDHAEVASVSLPYGRTGSQFSSSVQFTCIAHGTCDPNNPGICSPDQSWTSTANATFTAGTAPDDATRPASGGWALTNVVYSGSEGAINGQCGPTTGFCTSGTASAVSASAPWTWTCAGSSGGSDASCTSSADPPACQAGVIAGGNGSYYSFAGSRDFLPAGNVGDQIQGFPLSGSAGPCGGQISMNLLCTSGGWWVMFVEADSVECGEGTQ